MADDHDAIIFLLSRRALLIDLRMKRLLIQALPAEFIPAVIGRGVACSSGWINDVINTSVRKKICRNKKHEKRKGVDSALAESQPQRIRAEEKKKKLAGSA